MKPFYLLLAAVCLYATSMGQTDTTKEDRDANDPDTIRIGTMIIIRKGGKGTDDDRQRDSTTIEIRKRSRRSSNVSTNWGIVDLGFNNFTDKTDYGSAAAQQFAPGSTKDWFKLRNSKSVNVNIWIFMQRLNLIEHVVNLKYGIGLELNNYRFEAPIRFGESPTTVRWDSSTSYRKNKLAADYVTVPLILNFNFTPGKESYRSFGFSAGVSGGYLYSSRQKYINAESGKKKTRSDFDLRPYKLSYVAELQLGPVKLYGSLATQSMFEKALDQTPYNVGLRLSNW